MSKAALKSGRGLAFSVLTERGGFVADRLDRVFRREQPEGGARRTATEIATGLTRRRLTLNTILQHFVSRPLDQLEPDLRTLLQIGAYELLFLSTPSHAVVNECVELARARRGKRWTGIVNGVLRSIGRALVRDCAAGPSARRFPLSADRWCELKDDVFVDPSAADDEYLSQVWSVPRWLIERFRRDGLDLSTALPWFNSPPPLTLRVNLLRTTREELLKRLSEADVEASEGVHSQSIRLAGHAYVPGLPGFDDGAFSVQDESAMAAASLIDPQPGETLLDLCAAPGSKTTHLAELMRNEGRIVATDVDADRLDRIRENTSRLGIEIVEAVAISPDGNGLPDGPFDACLVDVPCSNTGVLGA